MNENKHTAADISDETIAEAQAWARYDQHQAETTPWRPPGENWIEWGGGKNPAPGAVVDVLKRYERDAKSFTSVPDHSEIWAWEWDPRFRSDDTVAYRVETPAEPTIDQALFKEAIDALKACARILPRYATKGKTTADDEECDAVLETLNELIAKAEAWS